jgi:hypothetical protein
MFIASAPDHDYVRTDVLKLSYNDDCVTVTVVIRILEPRRAIKTFCHNNK